MFISYEENGHKTEIDFPRWPLPVSLLLQQVFAELAKYETDKGKWETERETDEIKGKETMIETDKIKRGKAESPKSGRSNN